ncbi:kinase-like domain-containing protein [Gigaspora rosea]|uniref:Kinase-like domain-containing protein n=1 Tax=Gigaspora rosea TaxID=44941 RepID=A0A397VCY5_9GLOM|nr:kinase-like domain-containing protein [Gigaspora rosea]
MAYEELIEWVPFDRLSNVKEIGKGGFGSVYSTIWLDGISTTLQYYVSDLGLSKNKDKKDETDSGDIYGVIPYVAPEVLLGQGFTQAADIYGFGVIMSEMSTGQRPFDGHDFDLKLATKICKGLRPEIAPGTPDCYIELAKSCMDSDPKKRPSASDIQQSLEEWHKSVVISEPFFDADKTAKK